MTLRNQANLTDQPEHGSVANLGQPNPSSLSDRSISKQESNEIVRVKDDENNRTYDWQNKLLPAMLGLLTGLTMFFFIATSIQIYFLNKNIQHSPAFDRASILKTIDNLEKAPTVNQMDIARWKTLTLLEENSMERRYHQAGVLLMSRIWTRYLGFITGMIVALVGAVFILGKLRDPEATLNADNTLWKFSMTTASPGLVLALLGTILMVTTMVTQFELTVDDRPTYLTVFEGHPPSNVPSQPLGLEKPLEKMSDEEIIELMRKLDERKKSATPNK